MPSLAAYDNALLTSNRLCDESGEAAGALYTSAGVLVPESLRAVDRTDVWKVANPDRVPRPSPVIGKYNHDGYEFYLDEAILGGHVLAGWGHLITETVSTAWAARELPNAPIVIVPWGRIWVSALPRIRETLKLAGWDDRPLIVASGGMVFGSMHVPERLVRLDELMHEGSTIDRALNTVYDRMVERSRNPALPKSRVFLARPSDHRRSHPYEVDVETALLAKGFMSVRGWEMSVQEQIAMVDCAEALVAFSGSNLHNSVFASRGVPVVEIRDDRAQRDVQNGTTRLQGPLCALRDQPFTEVDGFHGNIPRPVADILKETLSAIENH